MLLWRRRQSFRFILVITVVFIFMRICLYVYQSGFVLKVNDFYDNVDQIGSERPLDPPPLPPPPSLIKNLQAEFCRICPNIPGFSAIYGNSWHYSIKWVNRVANFSSSNVVFSWKNSLHCNWHVLLGPCLIYFLCSITVGW